MIIHSNQEKYIIDFVIPAGPTGPANGLNAYGGLYDFVPTTVVANQTTPTIVPIDDQMPSFSVDYSSDGGITIVHDGIYEIFYHLTLSTLISDSVTIFVKNEDTPIDGTSTTVDLIPTNSLFVTGSVICQLKSGDRLHLAILCGKSTTLNVNLNDISFTVKKIDI